MLVGIVGNSFKMNVEGSMTKYVVGIEESMEYSPKDFSMVSSKKRYAMII